MSKISTNCFLYNKNKSDAGIPTEDIAARLCFFISDVSSVHECIKDKSTDDEETTIDPDRCIVYFKNGTSAEIDMSYDDLYMQVFAE
jgi:competence transcription factor ComK